MNFFKKKASPPPPITSTFKARVETFWKWWAENAPRIRSSVDQDGGAEIQPEISEQVNLLGPNFAWVLGPHPEGSEHGHSFTLSPEGMLNVLFLTSYWLERAPTIEGWHFYSSRQPSEALEGASIRIGDFNLATKELWLTPEIDEDDEVMHLKAWSPIFGEVEEGTAYQVLFLLLDEALGENGVSQWLGRIEIDDSQLADSFPLSELPEQIEEAKEKFGWDKPPLEDCFTLYSLKEPTSGAPRMDMLTLNTQNPRVTIDYLEADGQLEDPIPETGASYLFIQVPISQFPDGQQVDRRATLEDTMDEALRAQNAGRIIGGGLGQDFAYIDVLIFDGETSRNIITDSLEKNEARKFVIHPFAKE